MLALRSVACQIEDLAKPMPVPTNRVKARDGRSATHRPSIIKASRLSMRLALLLLITAVLAALARVPSRLNQGLNHGLGGRMPGAGLHSSASQHGEPKGLEDLSWWPDDRSHGSINRAFVRGKKEKQAPRPATSRTSPVNMVASSDESCLMGLSLATCLGGLANWVSDTWAGEEEMGDKHVVYANGKPTAMVV